MWKERVVRLKHLMLIIFVVVAWEAVVVFLNLPVYKLPRPSVIFTYIIENAQYVFYHTGLTISAAVLGFLIALMFSFFVAIGIVFSKKIKSMLFPLVLVIRVLPKIVLIPIFILWLGTGIQMKLVVVFLISFFPLVVNTTLGLMEVHPDLVDLARSLGGSTRDIFIKIRIPNSLPYIFTGMKIAIAYSVIGAIIAEFIAGQTGIGWLMTEGKAFFNLPQAFAALLLAAIVGFTLFRAVMLLEKKVVTWRKREEIILGTI